MRDDRQQLGTFSTVAIERRTAERTLVKRPRVDHNHAKLLPGPLGLQQHPLNHGRPGISKDDVAVVDLVDRMLLDYAVGEEDTVSDEGVELGEEEGFGLRGAEGGGKRGEGESDGVLGRSL